VILAPQVAYFGRAIVFVGLLAALQSKTRALSVVTCY